MTRTIINLSSTAVDITAHYPIDKATLVPMGAAGEKPNGDREITYQQTVGDDLHPLSARVGTYPAKSGSKLNNTSARINTFVSNDESGITVFEPCFVTVAMGMPFGFVPDEAGVMKLIQHCVSLLLPVVAGAYVDDMLDEIKFGVVTLAHTHVDS